MRKIPNVTISALGKHQGEKHILPFTSVGSIEWYQWLEQQISFSFDSLYGTITMRKEQRHGRWYWYAYRRKNKKLHTAYVGKTEELTLERLNETAQVLTSLCIQGREASSSKGEGEAYYSYFLDAPSLSTKLSLPSLPSNFIARPHLLQRLNEAMSHKLLLVSASAGSGKTTLISEWAQQSQYPIVWVSLDKQDDDPIRLWSCIIRALETLHTGISESALELLHSSEPQPLDAVLTLFINALSVIPHEFALVLDDYHVLTNPMIHDTLSTLLDHLPPHMHLIVTSRGDPPLPLPRLRAHGDLIELHTSDLRFLSHEARTFLRQNMRLDLPEEIISALELRTEGWIAGLQLAALSLQSVHNYDNFVEDFSGSHRYILDYLVEEVLYQQEQNVQTFLLYTSILERLSGSLCDAVTGSSGSHGVLEQLEHANLFLLPLDKQRHWYRYHHLFKDVLRDRLQNHQPDIVPQLHMRAYIWYKQHGLLSEAIDHAIAANAFEQAAQLIVLCGDAMIRNSEGSTLMMWLDMLPDETAQSHPQLCLLQAWTMTTLGRFDAIEPLLQQVEYSLKKDLALCPSHSFTASTTELSPLDEQEDYQNIIGSVAALRAHTAALWGNISSIILYAEQALAHLPLSNLYLRSLSTLDMGIAYWLQDDVVAAEQAFSQANLLGQAARNSYVALLALCSLAQVQMVQGQRRLAIKSGKQALKLASEGPGQSLPSAAYAYVGMGQHFYEWNDLKAAAYYLQEGIALSEQWKDGNMLVYGYTELAQVKQAQGDIGSANWLLLQAERYEQSHQQHSWIVEAMIAQKIRLALAQGDFDKAWYSMERTRGNNFSVFRQTLYARIHIAQEHFTKALGIVAQQQPIAQRKGQIGLVIELYVLEALAQQGQQNINGALLALEQALSLAEPEGYIRMFVNEGAPMSKLLTMILQVQKQQPDSKRSPILPEYIQKLLATLGVRAQDILTKVESDLATHHLPALETFSEREREIIQLIIAGLSNREIAQQLIIAETTVKWHIRNIFGKLNVQSRTQIAALARKFHW